MRITNSMMINEMMRNLNNSMQSMDVLQRQMATGKKISKPSDDPTGLIKSLRFRTNLNEGEKYKSNINEGVSFLETTDSAFHSVDEIMQRLRELTVKAATGTNEADSFKAIADEMRELNEQLKIIANTNYGGKYIFAGTNVTEMPYRDGKWLGNSDLMHIEIGVGVKIPINFNTKNFFMGRMEDMLLNKLQSGIGNIQSKGLQEGSYKVGTTVVESTLTATTDITPVVSLNRGFYDAVGALVPDGDLLVNFNYNKADPAGTGVLNSATYTSATPDVAFSVTAPQVGDTITFNPDNPLYNVEGKPMGEIILTFNGTAWEAGNSSISESQSYLGAIANNGKFFYESTDKAASLGVGTTVAANDSPYNGSLMIEVKKVETGLGRLLDPSPTAPKLEMNRSLYRKDGNGSLFAIKDEDMQQTTPYFTYTGAAGLSDAQYDMAARSITFNIATPPPANGDKITLNQNPELYDSRGNLIEKIELTYNGVEWVFEDTAKITVDIKGHVYDKDGSYKFVNLENRVLDMGLGKDKALLNINASDLPGGANLVVWNAGDVLGGIDPDNPQIRVGDKTVLALSAANVAGDKGIEHNYEYKDLNGKTIGAGSHRFNMNALAVDNQWSEYKFFTLNQETGLDYSGQIDLQGDVIESFNNAVEFSYISGLFEYVEDVSRKVELGKLPQVGNELAKHDSMFRELLLMRSTVGARVNRLELQVNRLDDAKVNISELLANTESANIAEVIMQLTMQENVYRSALAGGARIIQPSLMDFLR